MLPGTRAIGADPACAIPGRYSLSLRARYRPDANKCTELILECAHELYKRPRRVMPVCLRGCEPRLGELSSRARPSWVRTVRGRVCAASVRAQNRVSATVQPGGGAWPQICGDSGPRFSVDANRVHRSVAGRRVPGTRGADGGTGAAPVLGKHARLWEKLASSTTDRVPTAIP